MELTAWPTFASYKCKIVVRSVLGGETNAMADGFEVAFLLMYDLERMIGRKIPFCVLTGSKSLFNVIVKSTTNTERRLIIDVLAVCKPYKGREVDDVGWIRLQ